ncbi:SH3 domain-containing protein [Alkalihalobacillus clausii]|uniref:SH3 domain-containing protein n=5 Tax=Bacillaceae TaxID=186817 RepID=UPI00203DF792|nr:SH3 domain-containing protein [Shouchella clausii]
MFPIQKKLMLAGSSASIVALVASALPLQSAYASSITVKESHYDLSFDAAVDRQMGLSARPQTDKNGRWENASRSDVAYYMNANNFKQGTSSYLQFLNLSSSAGLSAEAINSQLLSDKGILQGQGQAFINASKLYGVNEIYLISHALLETGNGKSQLATGVQVNGKTVYNMYGIGAYDGNAVSAGAQYAYNQGWFTPEDAIIGGARFVSNNYFARGQNTLYKMRWNPANPGTYQYATDVGWAVKQTHQMSNLYSLVDDYEMTFDVPVYKNQPTGDAGNDKLEQLPTGTFGTTTARLNVRTGPGTSHSIVTTLDKDTKIELLAKQGNWYQIAVGNTTGFVSGDYLKLDKPSEDNVEDSDQEPISYGETTARLNLRSQPNTSSNVLTTLALGQKLEILKKEGNWYRVRAGHQSGWVSADFVKMTSNGEDKESPSLGSATTTARLNLRSGAGTNHSIITTLAKGQKVELLKKQGGWYQVKAGSRTGWVSADYLNVNGSGNVDNAPSIGSATTTARLNLRSGAGTNHSIITTLAKGQKVELLKKQGGWYQVKAGSRTGWVSADYLNVNGSGNVDNAPSIGSATTTARLNLRSGAGTNHSIITTLAKGQKVELLKKQGGWYQVKAGNRTGWVSADYLNVNGSDNVDNAPSIGSATTTARLNLRSGAGTNHSIITTLAKGQKVELLKKQGGWYQVKAGNRTGWVSADYLNVNGSGNVDNAPSIGSATTTARLNLRSGAGTNHSIITTLNKGQKVELLKKQGGWYQVKAGNRTGWVSADYLNVNGSGNVDNAPSIGSATTTARLNLRSGAGTNHSIITTLAKGQKVELLKKQGGWYQVKAGNRTGWVSADYLNVNGSGNVDNAPSIGSATTTARLNLRSGAGTNHSIITTLAKGQKVELLKKQGGWYQVKAGNRTGWVSADYLNVNGSGNVDNAPSIGSATTTARLNLRSGAGTNHSIITTLAKGQKVELLKKQGGWYQVKAGNRTGWVSADYLNVNSSGNVDNAPAIGSATTTARLNLRSGAGTNHSIITTLAKGQKVELLKKQGGWYQVKAGNRTGWVSADYLNVSNNQAKTESVETVIDTGTTTARLNLRVEPNTSSKIMTTLNNGQQLDILKKQGSWYYVKVGSQTGWVSSQYVKLTEAKPTVQVMARTFSFASIAPEMETNEEANEGVTEIVNEENDVSDSENSQSEKQQPVDEDEKEEDKQDVPESDGNKEQDNFADNEEELTQEHEAVLPDKELDTDENAEEPAIDVNDTDPHSVEANDDAVKEDDHVVDENEQASETTGTENDAENEENDLPASEDAPSEENDSSDESSLEEPQEDLETDASTEEQDPETDTNTEEQDLETDTNTEEQDPETDTSAEEQDPETDTSAEEQDPETDTSAEEQDPETDASADEQDSETDASTDEQDLETDASTDEQDPAKQVAEEEHGDADGTSEDQDSPVSDTTENNEADENSEFVQEQEEETDVADDEAEASSEEAEASSEQDEEPSEATEEQQTAVGKKIQLTENTLLFSEASSDSEQLLELFEDDMIEILEEDTDFVKVKANGVEGWIAVEALAAVLH